MVVNYDLPLMNERMKGADERPDIETYIHRIGESQESDHALMMTMENRTNRSLWQKGHLDQFRTRQENVAADGTD